MKRISHLLAINDQNQEDTALLIQPMVYGNYGKDSSNGQFYTRNIVTGAKEIQGEYYQGKFNAIGTSGSDIANISKTYHTELEKIARKVEDHFKELRSIRFTVENKRLWLIDQRSVMTKSTQSDIQLLLDLYARKIVSDQYVVKQIKPGQLNEILHPIIDFTTVKGMPLLSGGITGAPGAAIGRVFFSTEGLLEAHKLAHQKGQDTKMILCLPASFAEDVKAIEVATGVLSTEGGYSAHASVVARQYGKVSLVKPDMKIKGNRATIGDKVIKEGDYITLNVPFYGAPSMYLGKAELIEPDPEESGMLDFLEPGGEVRFGIPRPGKRRQAAGRRPRPKVRGERHRSCAHGAHVLRREEDQCLQGNGPLRFRGRIARRPSRAFSPCRRRTSTSF